MTTISTKPTAKMYCLNILWTDTWIGYPPLHINERVCSGALISLHKLHNTVLLSINMVLFSYQYLKWVPDITLQKKQYRLTPCPLQDKPMDRVSSVYEWREVREKGKCDFFWCYHRQEAYCCWCSFQWGEEERKAASTIQSHK